MRIRILPKIQNLTQSPSLQYGHLSSSPLKSVFRWLDYVPGIRAWCLLCIPLQLAQIKWEENAEIFLFNLVDWYKIGRINETNLIMDQLLERTDVSPLNLLEDDGKSYFL